MFNSAYCVSLDRRADRWERFVQNIVATLPPTPGGGWINKAGNVIQYNGEIHHKKTQMPGISTAKCLFSDCRYSTPTTPNINPAFVEADLWQEATGHYLNAEWGEERVGAAPVDQVAIWDKKP